MKFAKNIAKNRHLVAVCFALFWLSCEAPHINPLDPDNPENEFRALRGRVMTETIPRQPIRGVNVSWETDNIVVQTNFAGEYLIEKLSRTDGWLIFSKAGYLPDSQKVEWHNLKIITVDKFMNSIPQIESISVYSTVENRHSREDVLELVVEAKIVDKENDVDTVFIENNELNLSKKLQEITRGSYRKVFNPLELGLTSLELLIGKELSLVVRDKLGNKFEIATSNLKRIISQEVEPIEPVGKDTVGVSPTLVWKRFDPGFQFTFSVQVITDDISQDLVWEIHDIPSDSISVFVDSPVSGNAENEYFWVIWAIDEFNNRTRSKPASFIVLQE